MATLADLGMVMALSFAILPTSYRSQRLPRLTELKKSLWGSLQRVEINESLGDSVGDCQKIRFGTFRPIFCDLQDD